MKACFSAPGKLVLAGEYAVLEGYVGICVAINNRARCYFEEGTSITVTGLGIGPFEVKLEHDQYVIEDDQYRDFEAIRCAFNVCLAKALTVPSGHYSFDSSEMFSHQHKLGIGSSAAIVTTLCALILEQNQKSYDAAGVFELAFAAHQQFNAHLGSGMDVAASSFGGWLSYQHNQVTPIDETFPKNCVLTVFTGQSQSTRAFLKEVGVFRDRDPQHYAQIMKELGKRSLQIKESLTPPLTPDFSLLHRSVNQVFFLMKRLGEAAHIPIIQESHHTIYQLAKQVGASMKPSGAGGGDIALCFGQPSSLHDLKMRLLEHGFHVLDPQFCAKGVLKEEHD